MNYTQSTLNSKHLKPVIQVNISKPVHDQIKYMCTRIHYTEWSGLLFYTLDGSIKNPSKLKLNTIDILPMDVGTMAETSFVLDKRYTDYLEEDLENRTQLYVGLIHSHHNMPTFFSTQDMTELLGNAPGHNFYLSLIVNNMMQYSCKVSVHSEFQYNVTPSFEALDENGEPYLFKSPELEKKEEIVYTYDCKVVDNEPVIKVGPNFISKVGVLEQRAKIQSQRQYLPTKISKKNVHRNYVWEDNEDEFTGSEDLTNQLLNGMDNFDSFLLKLFLTIYPFKKVKCETLQEYLRLLDSPSCQNVRESEAILKGGLEKHFDTVYEEIFEVVPLDDENLEDNILGILHTLENERDDHKWLNLQTDIIYDYYTKNLILEDVTK